MNLQKAIIGKKVGMTQIFDESGKVVPVTVIEAGPCAPRDVDGDARDDELLDVAIDGTGGAIELGRELGGAHPPLGEQREEDAEHDLILHRSPDPRNFGKICKNILPYMTNVVKYSAI